MKTRELGTERDWEGSLCKVHRFSFATYLCSDITDERDVRPYRLPYVDEIGEQATQELMIKAVVQRKKRPQFPPFCQVHSVRDSWKLLRQFHYCFVYVKKTWRTVNAHRVSPA